MAEPVYYYVETNTPVYWPSSGNILDRPSQYPKDWFTTPNKKPSGKICKYADVTDNIYKAVRYGFQNENVSLDLAKVFLHKFFESQKSKLNQNWKSYDTVIGEANTEISPWSILTIEVTDTALPNLNVIECDPRDPKWMACALLAPARLLETTTENYGLKKKIFDLMRALHCPLRAFPPKTMYQTWNNDDVYKKMVAAIDMYLNKFPEHDCHPLRICTLGSRYKGCSALLSIGHMTNVLKLPNESMVLDWIFTEKLGQEVRQMYKEEEEVVSEFSYFPYQLDLGLVSKTYYSSKKNPHLYFFIHAVCTLLQSKRSMNAKFLCENILIKNIIIPAKITAYAFANSGSRLPDGHEWFVHVKAQQSKLDPKVVAFVDKAKEEITEFRKGSIGEYVKQNF